MGVGGSLIDDSDEGEVLRERDDRDEPTELGGLLEYDEEEKSSDRREAAKRLVSCSMVGAKSSSRIWRDA